MMLTKTTELAIQSLLYLSGKPIGHLATPAEISGELGESMTYLSKVLRLLVQAGILASHRGKAGGVELVRLPREVTLLEVVESCQGILPSQYCRDVPEGLLGQTCGYHRAMIELRNANRAVLRRWTLARVLRDRPGAPEIASRCKIALFRATA